MTFETFAKLVHERFNAITKTGEVFHVNASKDDLWTNYLESFPEGSNPLFRERTEHDCATCRQFIKGVGGIVVLDAELNVQTVWDVAAEGPYKAVAASMAEFVRAGDIDRVFRTREKRYGTERNTEVVEGGPNIDWHHFHCEVPSRFVVPSVGDAIGSFSATHQVFNRGLQEFSLSALETVRDLIESNSLYRGEEHLSAVSGFLALKRNYEALSSDKRTNFVWANLKAQGARFRNTAIGTLVQDISGGMGINEAVARFESKVAPHNYRRSSAPITKGMIDKALKTLEELGLGGAVYRRFANIGDVSPNDVLFVDRDVRPKMKDGLADLLMAEVKPAAWSSKSAVEVDAVTFFDEVLPGAEKIEVEVSPEHMGNFVSLTAPAEKSTGRLFHWGNDFAWVYDGNVTDSIKQRVKAAGGNVNAFLRVSLSWFNYDDLDIHAKDPSGNHICYSNKRGILDVDMNAGYGGTRTPVENLAWKSLADGEYRVWVHQFNKRESVDVGFEIEYEYQGAVIQASYPNMLRQNEDVQVCTITAKKGVVTNVSFSPSMQRGASAGAEKWGITTGQMVPVETVMLSPNHWGPEEQRKGNRHHIFVLQGCKNPEPVHGFFNEYLRSDLHQHRKVFEVLAGKLKAPPTDDQLSGLGFSSTRHDRATFAVQKDGTIRTYKVQF